jgi:hypothetical protein
MTFFADANRAQFLVGSQRAALTSNARGLITLGAFEHHIRDMQGHRLLDDAALSCLSLRADVLFDDIPSLYDHFADLGERPRNGAFLPLIFAGNDQNGVTPFDIHFAKMERLFLFVFYCHLFPR